jgi:hypothetical protein
MIDGPLHIMNYTIIPGSGTPLVFHIMANLYAFSKVLPQRGIPGINAGFYLAI